MADMPSSLRERKKAKTRLAIREHAMELFAKQGYDETTVEQIAAAAEVSPSTFFRYFPSKEEVVLQDDYDALLLAAFHAQSPDVAPLEALRNAITDVFSAMPESQRAQEAERTRLLTKVPELRARMLAQGADMISMLAEAVAQRVGRQADEFEVRTFAGALIGVALAVAEAGSGDYLEQFNRALLLLEAGLPL
jgi:AcrR family transcriptional regulator